MLIQTKYSTANTATLQVALSSKWKKARTNSLPSYVWNKSYFW